MYFQIMFVIPQSVFAIQESIVTRVFLQLEEKEKNYSTCSDYSSQNWKIDSQNGSRGLKIICRKKNLQNILKLDDYG